MLDRPSDDTLQALKRFGAATIHEAQGQKGAVDSAIRSLNPALRLAGVALTVKCRPSDNLALHYALTKAKRGDVIVVDADGFVEAGPWGDVMTLAAQTLGVAGLVIDGSVRDSDSIIEMGFPVFSRGVSIKGTNKFQPGKVGLPITIGGVTVRTGDVIVGDRDGLVVVQGEEAEQVVALCAAREAKEDDFRRRLRRGETTVDLLGVQALLKQFGMD